jgi:hypothetical protein
MKKLIGLAVSLVFIVGCANMNYNMAFDKCEKHCNKYHNNISFEGHSGDSDFGGSCYCDKVSSEDKISLNEEDSYDSTASVVTAK